MTPLSHYSSNLSITKRSYTLKQTCGFQLQVYLSAYDLTVDSMYERVKNCGHENSRKFDKFIIYFQRLYFVYISTVFLRQSLAELV